MRSIFRLLFHCQHKRISRPITLSTKPGVITRRTNPAACGIGAHHHQVPRQHLFVGSGVIEAGCKTVIGSRLKQSGMFWTVRDANAILALRCCHLNGRFEDYWEARRAA
jgi:hypothetical protein